MTIPQDYDRQLWRGINAARAGHLEKARQIFHQLAIQDEVREDAWLWLAGLARNPREARGCLIEAWRRNPRNPKTLQSLQDLGYDPRSRALPRRGQPWAWIAGLLALSLFALTALSAALLFLNPGKLEGTAIPIMVPWAATPTLTPSPTSSPQERVEIILSTLGDGWAREDWPAVIARLQAARALVPAHPVVEEKLFAAYYNQAMALSREDRLEEAIAYLDSALAIRPQDAQASTARHNAASYLQGRQACLEGNWERAIAELTPLYQADKEYKGTATLLAEAHYQVGFAHQEAGKLEEAKVSYQAALAIKADHQGAQTKLEEVLKLLPPPKRIVVDLSEQHLYAWEGDQLVFSWVCSTGKPGRPTAVGNFSVLEKIPMAYASAWDLHMPYWLGIYWAGSTQNGIHALPILSNGQRLWEGLLGQRVSYGCIILGTEEAKTLYEWADLGTPVSIVH